METQSSFPHVSRGIDGDNAEVFAGPADPLFRGEARIIGEAIATVERSARKIVAGAAEGDMLRTQMAILRRLAKYEPADAIAIGRQIARVVTAAGRYTL